MKKKIKISLTVFISISLLLGLFGAYKLGSISLKANIPINSNNQTYKIYAQNAVINNGKLIINGVIQNTVTGDSATFATESTMSFGK